MGLERLGLKCDVCGQFMLPVQSYLLQAEDIDGSLDVTLERRPRRITDGQWDTVWAIRRGPWCLNKDGKWIIDRIPPEMPIREWQVAHRWENAQAAYEFWATRGERT